MTKYTNPTHESLKKLRTRVLLDTPLLRNNCAFKVNGYMINDTKFKDAKKEVIEALMLDVAVLNEMSESEYRKIVAKDFKGGN